MKRAIALIAASFLLLFGAQSVLAQKGRPVKTVKPSIIIRNLEIKNTARRTSFDPKVHGFNFSNTFKNNFVSEFDVRTGGLCGGMVWAALDYWKTSKKIPQQTYLPTEGSTLQSYIYDRQYASIERNLDRWAELGVNPGGARNNEFWRWGMEGKRGGRLDELKRTIDSGRPVPLGLQSCSEGCQGNHQVLAIGYDMGRYKGDLGAHKNEFRIFVYDPNLPSKTMVLRSNPATRHFYYETDTNRKWRTYFVDANWRLKNPPTINALERELLLTFGTGEDDLRSRLTIAVERNNGRDLSFLSVNNGKRWISNSTQTVAVSLPAGVAYNNLTGIRIRRWSSDMNDLQKAGTDNWDLRRLLVRSGDADGKKVLFQRSGSPLHRFTADARVVAFQFGTASNELIATFATGNDDLRGGNDNADLVLLLRNGRNHRFANVNERRKWEEGASITRYLTLPAGMSRSDIVGVRIETTLGGGMGGDNWNLQSLRLKTRESGTTRQIFYKDGEPLFRFKGENGKRKRTWRF